MQYHLSLIATKLFLKTGAVTKSKQVAIDKKQMNLWKWTDKNTKDCTEVVS